MATEAREVKLKPCPFCGSEPVIKRDDNNWYVVKCVNLPGCNVQPSTQAPSLALATMQWNSRSAEQELVDALRQAKLELTEAASIINGSIGPRTASLFSSAAERYSALLTKHDGGKQ